MQSMILANFDLCTQVGISKEISRVMLIIPLHLGSIGTRAVARLFDSPWQTNLCSN